MVNAFYRQTDRNSAIELLRIFAGLAIIVLHFNFWNLHVVDLTTGLTQKVLLILEAICVCAVNVFILISGYCSANSRKVNVSRLVNIIIQTSAFSFIFAVLGSIMHDSWQIKRIIGSLLPVNYYVILYVALMFIAPFINIVMDRLSKACMKKFIWIVMCVFSIYPTLIDVLEEVLGKTFMGLNSISIKGSIEGYTVINFMLVYTIGVYIRKNDLVKKINNSILKISVISSIVAIFIWHEILPKSAYNYSSPLVILEACIIFMMFAKMDFKQRFINFVAPASFTCVLIHGYFLVWIGKYVPIEDSFCYVMLLLSVCLVGIYVVSVVVMMIWNFMSKHLFAVVVDKLPIIKVEEK